MAWRRSGSRVREVLMENCDAPAFELALGVHARRVFLETRAACA